MARRLLPILVAVSVPLLDVILRARFIFSFSRESLAWYAAASVASAVLWASLFLLAASPQRGKERTAATLLGVVLAAVLVGGQIYLFARYNNYLDARAALVGTGMLPSVGQQLWFDRFTFARTALVPPCVWVGLVLLARRLGVFANGKRYGHAWDAIVVSALVATLAPTDAIRDQGLPPDIMYLSAVGQVLNTSSSTAALARKNIPAHRNPLPVPPVAAKNPRSVVLIVTESVRAQSACNVFEPDCAPMPFSNRAFPLRLGLNQMRALDSTTALSLAALWAGVEPSAPRAEFLTMPLIWEYGAAAGYDTAYFTSQNLFFANSGAWLEGIPARLRTSGTELDPDATYETGADDETLMNHALAKIATLKAPFLAVVHLSNTHFPYRIGDEAPFGSSEKYRARDEQLNRYEDSIYRQDGLVAHFASAIRRAPHSRDAVIVYTSDHGEQLREKGAIGHTGTLYDVEVRVPFWLDAPPSVLSNAESASLAARRNVATTQLDVLPTLVDLMGIWDAPEVRPFRERLPGASLLRGGTRADRMWVMTNCSSFWTCAFKNWGAIGGTRKLLAHQGDRNWKCYDLARDPEEKNDLGPLACDDLRTLVEHVIPGTPF